MFLMVEDNFGLYVMTGLWRALFRRRTLGLLFRPGPAVDGSSARLRLKRVVLRLLRQIPAIQTFSIVPVPLEPKIGSIVDGWIHDFQLWDLSVETRLRIAALRNGGRPDDEPDATALLGQARKFAADRPLLVAIGAQNRNKGVEILARSMREGGTQGWAIMVAGRFDAASAQAKAVIKAEGGLVIDRHLSDAEIEVAYAAADAVWCLYDPAYDQASGIMGRAVQLGLPAVTRKGSFSEALCRDLHAPHIAANGGQKLAGLLEQAPSPQPDHAQGLSLRLASENILRLKSALRLEQDKP